MASDFSGEWTLNVSASTLSPVVAPVVQSGFVRIEHREPIVSVHLSITMDGKPFDVRFERASNGTATPWRSRTERRLRTGYADDLVLL